MYVCACVCVWDECLFFYTLFHAPAVVVVAGHVYIACTPFDVWPYRQCLCVNLHEHKYTCLSTSSQTSAVNVHIPFHCVVMCVFERERAEHMFTCMVLRFYCDDCHSWGMLHTFQAVNYVYLRVFESLWTEYVCVCVCMILGARKGECPSSP